MVVPGMVVPGMVVPGMAVLGFLLLLLCRQRDACVLLRGVIGDQARRRQASRKSRSEAMSRPVV